MRTACAMRTIPKVNGFGEGGRFEVLNGGATKTNGAPRPTIRDHGSNAFGARGKVLVHDPISIVAEVEKRGSA